ncbi:MAG: hypothetical protein MJA27_04320 [Pseudanabaenales cyanobacterium]|nr:hypothetical protein [Pseudanabaenales cyanobacterium]
MADLSGNWLGTYWQAGSPTRFEATLVHGGNVLGGRILDDGNLGEAQIVSGEVVGRSVGFTKRYLTSSNPPIVYTGTISEDGDSMQGQWRINRSNSGLWEAHRSKDDLTAELQRRMAKQLAVSAGRS